MSNIIDKIRVSGTDYTLSATSSGGNPTIEVTQAEYDALVSAGTVSADTYYIITDSSIDYINSAQCQSQIDSSISGKADASAVTEAIDAAVSGKVSTNDFNAYSGATDTLINSKASQSDLNSLSGTVTGHTANTNIHLTSAEKTNIDSLATNIAAISGITATKVGNWDTAYTNNHTHSNKSALDAITGNVGTMAYENVSSYSSATEVNSALGNKLDISEFNTYSGSVNTTINSKASQTDLNTLSGTVTAHTANTNIHLTSAEKANLDSLTGAVGTMAYQDADNYYAKNETSGKTEIATALSGKQATLVSSENIKTINNESILGSGNITIQSEVSSAITSGDTNAVAGGAVYDKFDEVEQVTAAALNDINDRVSEDEEVTAAALNALNTNKQDKLSAGTGIEISGNVISATGGGGGNPTVELTQAEYDALVSAGTVSADTYYIITDATPVDMSNYYTSAQTNTLLAEKQDTLSAGRGISISSNVVSFSLPISAGTGANSVAEGQITTASGNYSHAEGYSTKATGNYSHAEGRGTTAGAGSYTHAEGYFTNATGNYSHAEGYNTTASAYYAHAEGSTTTASGQYSHAEGRNTIASGESSHVEGAYTTANNNCSHAEGAYTTANTSYSHAEGRYTITNNVAEHASGQYNVSSSASIIFGDSGNTLFSVGNGNAISGRHNAFEIRQNGDIYIVSGGTDIKLQDHLGGGGSGTVSSAITSGDTNAVAGGAVYNRFDEVEQVTAQALNVLNESLSGKQDTLSAGTNITIVDNVISAQGGSITIDPSLDSGSTNPVANSAITTALNAKSDKGNFNNFILTSKNGNPGAMFKNDNGGSKILWLSKINGTKVFEISALSQAANFSLVETSAITTSVTSASTDAQVPSAKAVNDKLGGLSLVKLTQAQYDALATKDNNTLYVIVN